MPRPLQQFPSTLDHRGPLSSQSYIFFLFYVKCLEICPYRWEALYKSILLATSNNTGQCKNKYLLCTYINLVTINTVSSEGLTDLKSSFTLLKPFISAHFLCLATCNISVLLHYRDDQQYPHYLFTWSYESWENPLLFPSWLARIISMEWFVPLLHKNLLGMWNLVLWHFTKQCMYVIFYSVKT